MAFLIAVSCKNLDCAARAKPIVLPLAIPQEIAEHHPLMPIPDFSVIVACPACGLVSSHTAYDSQVRDVPQEDPLLTRSRIACAETKCDEENCGVRIKIHTQ